MAVSHWRWIEASAARMTILALILRKSADGAFNFTSIPPGLGIGAAASAGPTPTAAAAVCRGFRACALSRRSHGSAAVGANCLDLLPTAHVNSTAHAARDHIKERRT